jgi:hypothetical protein
LVAVHVVSIGAPHAGGKDDDEDGDTDVPVALLPEVKVPVSVCPAHDP